MDCAKIWCHSFPQPKKEDTKIDDVKKQEEKKEEEKKETTEEPKKSTPAERSPKEDKKPVVVEKVCKICGDTARCLPFVWRGDALFGFLNFYLPAKAPGCFFLA